MYVNGKPKEELAFRRNMGYVEQFDSLCPRDTAREAIEFRYDDVRLDKLKSYKISFTWSS
jgi:ABC-type multidrug transport system ATPase subunit